jgi:hypothetical protein
MYPFDMGEVTDVLSLSYLIVQYVCQGLQGLDGVGQTEISPDQLKEVDPS